MASDKLRGKLSPKQNLQGAVNRWKGMSDHRLLDGLTGADQHPIKTIIGLQDELDARPSASELSDVALSGDINDLTQDSGECIVIYCGSASDIL